MCRVPESMLLPDGYCINHSPDPVVIAKRDAARLKGGLRTTAANKKGLDAEDLGELQTPEDACRQLAVIAKATATGQLSSSAGSAATGALREWLKARDLMVREARLGKVEDALRKAKLLGMSE